MSKLSLVKPQGRKLVLGEKEYDLVYDFNAYAELEEVFGSVQEAFKKLDENPKMSDILKIVKAGTASCDEEVTLKELGKYLVPATLPQVIEELNEAIKIGIPNEAASKSKTAKN